MQGLAVKAIYVAEGGIADVGRLLQHGRKHRLEISWRTGDDLENLRRGRLLFQCFSEIVGAAAKVVGALTQLVEQPCVLDGDHGLGGEVRDQRDLLVGEWLNFLPEYNDGADQHIVSKHWHCNDGSRAGEPG